MVVKVLDDTLRLIGLIESTMDKVDPELTECLLLSTSLGLVEADV